MQSACKVCRSVSFIKPILDQFPQGYQSIFRHYTKDFYERARAFENAHFLKIQYEQLQSLQNKIKELKERKNSGNVDANLKVNETQIVITQQADN